MRGALSQCIHISVHHDVYFECLLILFVTCTSVKLKNITVVRMCLKPGGETDIQKGKMSFSKFNRASVADDTDFIFLPGRWHSL